MYESIEVDSYGFPESPLFELVDDQPEDISLSAAQEDELLSSPPVEALAPPVPTTALPPLSELLDTGDQARSSTPPGLDSHPTGASTTAVLNVRKSGPSASKRKIIEAKLRSLFD